LLQKKSLIFIELRRVYLPQNLNVLALAPQIVFISAGSASTFMALHHNTAEKAVSGGNLKESKNDSGTQSDEERENELFSLAFGTGPCESF
jgi:hypothetical protein